MSAAHIVLLGPQRPKPQAGAVLRALGVDGPVATITAGWQEWESDDEALRGALGLETVPLHLYARAERVWAADPELRAAHRQVQDDLRAVRELYARQLARAGDTWIELLEADGPERILGPERDAALAAVRRLDAHHLARIDGLQDEFRERFRPGERDTVARERAEIARALGSAGAVLVEGGHVAVLANRIGMFDLAHALTTEPLAARPLIGCAAGAMALCERVVLFNDSPAIGRGHAEVGLRGLGLVPGVVVLPDARARLRLDDAARMRRLSLRLAPDRCALLDPGDRLDWDGERLTGSGGRYIDLDGRVAGWERAA